MPQMQWLVEWSLPKPDIRGLYLDIGKILSTNCTKEKMKIKKKRLGMAHLKKMVIDVNVENTIRRKLKMRPYNSEQMSSL